MIKIILSTSMMLFIGIAVSNAQTETKPEGKACSKSANATESKACCSKSAAAVSATATVNATNESINQPNALKSEKSAKGAKPTHVTTATHEKKEALKKENK